MTKQQPDHSLGIDYRMIFDNASNGMAFTSAVTGRIIDVNASWTHATGITRQAAIGRTALELGLWANAGERDACLAELERDGQVEECEAQLVTRHGNIPYLISGRIIDAGGERCVLWEFRDISAQRLASQAAERAADWHRALLQNTADGICIFDAAKSVIEVNDRFAMMLGYTASEMSGMHPWDWDSNTSAADLDARFPPSPDTHYSIETCHRRKDGSVYDAEVTIRHARIGDRNVVVTVARDITERKRLEAQLRHAREALEIERGFLKTLVRTIPNLVWMKDPEGVYLACNAEFERFFGHPEAEIVGKSDYDFIDRELAEFFRAHDRAAMAAGKPTVNEEWITYACDGHRAFLVTTKTPMHRPDGSVIGVLGVAQDITEQQHATHELARSQALLRSVLDSVPVRIFWKDRDCRYLGCNPLFARDAGKSTPDDLVGKFDDDMGWAAEADLYRADDRAVMESGIAKLNFVEPQTTPDGRTIYLSTSKVPLRDEQGKVFGILGVYDDITARKQAEDQLRESEARFRHLYESSPDAAWILDGHRFIQANRAAIRLFGKATEADFLNVHPSELSPEYQPDGESSRFKAERMMAQADRQGVHRFEWLHLRADGTEFDAEVTLSALEFYGKGALYAVIRDITERKAAEKALNRLNEELEARVLQKTADLQASYAKLRDTEFAMDKVGIGIHWVDAASGRFLHVNRYAASLLGYTQEELLQRTVSDIDPHFPEAAFREINERIRLAGFMKFETEQLRRDGSLVPVEMTVYYHSSEGDGLPQRMISFMLDITERKAAEQALLQARQAAEMASQAKSSFLANMSHEIRTPLNAILGLSHLMRGDHPTPAQLHRLNRMDIAGRHLLSIINDILDLSKIEAGGMVLESGNFHLSAVLDNVSSIVREAALDKGLAIEIDPDGVPLWLRGDVTRLRQALLNFASNAVKFTHQGKVVLRAELLDSRDRDLTVRFEVIDTGIGLTAEQLARLFQPFEQADSSTARKYGGTGLGLFLTRRLVELMNGKVGADSTAGGGSRFWFTVPLQRGYGPTPKQAQASHAQSTDSQLRQHYRGARILLAEDNPINVEVVQEMLHAAGLDVTVVEHGQAACEAAALHKFDLMLIDMQMPVMDGVTATRQIRSMLHHAQTPILALTANAFAEDRQECLAAGMNDVLTKPVEPALLFGALFEWLSHNRKSTAQAEPTVPVGAAVTAIETGRFGRLVDLAGFDLQNGLTFLSGNTGKYLTTLQHFSEAHGHDGVRLGRCLEEGNQAAAQQLTHALRGAAGVLGLTAIADIATQVEIRLRQPESMNHDRAILLERAAALHAALEDLAAAMPPPEPEASIAHPTFSGAAMQQAVAHLVELLDQHDLQSVAFLDENIDLLHAACGADFGEVEHQIRRFAFDVALSTLRKLH